MKAPSEKSEGGTSIDSVGSDGSIRNAIADRTGRPLIDLGTAVDQRGARLIEWTAS